MIVLFGGVWISSYQAKNTLLDSLIKGDNIGQIANKLLNKALGLDTFVNPISCFIFDQMTHTTLQLPVNPQAIRVRWQRKMETVNILNIGEVDFTTGDKLEEINISSFFPQEYVPTYCVTSDLPTPESANAVMNSWKSRFNDPVKGLPDPLHLVITGAQQINMNVILTSYSSEEHGGEPGDIYFSATFREWKSIAVRKQSEEKEPKRITIKERPKIVKISTPPEDIFGTQENLWKLAKQHYGQGKSWSQILDANAGNIGTGIAKVVLP